MNIDQETRDKLREKQYELQSTIIGAIVEHRIQDPAQYRQTGRTKPTNEDIIKSLDEKPICNENKTKIVEAKRKKKTIVGRNSENDKSDGETTKEPSKTDLPQLDNTNELPIKLEEVYQGNWVNMNKLEFDKLAWIMQENRTKVESIKGSSKQARFNIEGKLVIQSKGDKESVDIVPTHLGLHHHGDEPDMAGYTIEELLCYLNSSYERQRVLAMNVLGNIVIWAHKSSYDNIFDLNITPLILNEALLTVRVNLDSPNETTVIHALRCLHAFICNTNIDEILLDRAFFLFLQSPSKNLWLEPNCWSDKNDPNYSCLPDMSFFPDDMSDGDCVKKDPIVALVERTELITRLRYLLETKLFKGNIDHTIEDCIFDILIRIARHSPRMCSYLSGYPYLLQAIQETFLPMVITSSALEMRRPSVKALKFIRIIASADLENDDSAAADKEGGGQSLTSGVLTTVSSSLNWQLSSLLPVLLSYIYIEPMTENEAMIEHCMQISIETLRCWSVFLQLKSIKDEATNYFAGVIPNVKRHVDSIKSLDAIERGEDGKINIYDWQYATGLINVLNKLSRTLTPSKIFLPEVSYLVFKWTQEIRDMNMIPNLNVSLALTSGVEFLVQNNYDLEKLQNVFLKTMTDEPFLKLITKCCLPRTPLTLSENYSGCIRDSPNLPSFGSILFNRTTTQSIKLTPFLEEDSSFLLFRSIIECIDVIECRPHILNRFFRDQAFHDYLVKIRRLDACANGFEVEVKSRLFEQCELLTVAKSIITICRHYVAVDNNDEEHRNYEDYNKKKPIENTKRRLQCYDNLFAMAMTCVSLFTSRSKEARVLRQKLLLDIVLNVDFYDRLVDEMSPSARPIDKLSYNMEVKEGGSIPYDCIKLIYEDCKFSNKLWLFEPMIKYYSGEQETTTNTQEKNVKNEKRQSTLSTIDENQTITFTSKVDENIIVVLNLINLICKSSKIYSNLVIKPNLEDCLCLVGTVFLTDGLFLDPLVSRASRQIISTLLRECIDPHNDEENLPFQDPAKKLKGLNLSVYDFFIKLVDQYEGASYGDPAFSNFLMLFLTPKSHPSHKRYLFSEKASTCISQMRIGRDEIWIPEKILFAHREKDEEIIGLYRQCASSLRGKPHSAIQMFLNFHIS